MRKRVNMSRGARRVFAKKTQPSYSAMRNQFSLRGGGYL